MSLSFTDKDVEDWVNDNPEKIKESFRIHEQFLASQEKKSSDARRKTAQEKITTWEPQLAYDQTKTAQQKRQKAYDNIGFLNGKKKQSESAEETDEINKRIRYEEAQAKHYKGQR